jgi:hypothetical protein
MEKKNVVPEDSRRPLLGMTLDELKAVAVASGLPGLRGSRWPVGCMASK